LFQLVLTFAVGLIIGLIFYKLKVPGGMMIGAIVGVAALNITTGMSSMPYYAKFVAQTTAGAFIGCSIEKSDIKRMPHLIKPLSVLLGIYLAVNLSVGIIIWKTTPVDLTTALMSAVPGGMTDTPIIAADMGANAAQVAVLQFVRMTVGIGFSPRLIQRIDKKYGVDAAANNSCGHARHKTGERSGKIFAATLVIAVLGGITGRMLGIPAGVLVFSMIAVMIFKLFSGHGFLPMWAKRIAQVLSGAYVGSGITRSDVFELKYLILPALTILIFYTANCLLTGYLFRRRFGFSRKVSMLIATPAGASDMALISSDIGVNSTDLIVIQVARMILVISLFPQVIQLVVNLLES